MLQNFENIKTHFTLYMPYFSRKSHRLWWNVEKYFTVRLAKIDRSCNAV